MFLGKLEKANFPLYSKFSSKQENMRLTLSVIHGLRGKFRASQYIQHQNLYLPANKDDLTPKQFYYLGFISELQRFFDISEYYGKVVLFYCWSVTI